QSEPVRLGHAIPRDQFYQLYRWSAWGHSIQLCLLDSMSHRNSHTTQYPGQVDIGSSDFCAAAQHFQQAFKIQFGINAALNSHCELVPPTGGWPSTVTALHNADCDISPATANVCMEVRT